MSQRHFLFLQGNATPFYRRLGECLAAKGCGVSRINPSGGDFLFWGKWNAIQWRRSISELADDIPRIMQQHSVSDLILFGDCRPLHRAAIAAAQEAGIRVNVFEEGYLRPHWITLELGGVNGFSALPDDPEWYKWMASTGPEPGELREVGGGLRNRILYDFIWQIGNYVLFPWFPQFKTHRPYPIWQEYAGWAGRLTKLMERKRASHDLIMNLIAGHRDYMVFLLQLDTDSQIRVHSPWGGMVPALEAVINSFCRHAPGHLSLIIKNHPLDNGMIDYAKFVRMVADRHGCKDRVHFIDGGDLVALASHASGIVTINSTAAMVGLGAGVPVIALGTSIFDMPGLTFQGSLDAFWQVNRHDAAPSPELLAAYTKVLRQTVLVNGNFYTDDGIAVALENSLTRLLSTSSPFEGAPPPRRHLKYQGCTRA